MELKQYFIAKNDTVIEPIFMRDDLVLRYPYVELSAEQIKQATSMTRPVFDWRNMELVDMQEPFLADKIADLEKKNKQLVAENEKLKQGLNTLNENHTTDTDTVQESIVELTQMLMEAEANV